MRDIRTDLRERLASVNGRYADEMVDYDRKLGELQECHRQAIAVLERERAVLEQLLAILDATIRLFNPGVDLVEIKPKPLPARNQAFRGEVSRIVLGTLRKAEKSLPTHRNRLARYGLAPIRVQAVSAPVRRCAGPPNSTPGVTPISICAATAMI